jgi:hypothetical protein
MSALGQKQTLRRKKPMSALPPKADIGQRDCDVRFVPNADITQCSKLHLLDHLIGGHLDRHRHVEIKRLCGLEVEHELEFGGLHHRQVGGLRATEDPAGVDADLTATLAARYRIPAAYPRVKM